MNAEPTTPELVAMLYARHPDIFNAPRRPWVGLTDEQREACTQSPFTEDNYDEIEAKLKELNQ